MKQIAALLTALLTTTVMAALPKGAVAPAFTAQASFAGKASTLSLQEVLKKGPAVVYFYPSAYTSGCNVQAHTFAVNADKFAAAGATIVGVSMDSIARLNDFSADPDYCAGKFATVADADGAIAKSYDLEIEKGDPSFKDSRGQDIGHDFAERTTFVVGQDGKIIATIGGKGPASNVKAALKVVQQLQVKKPN